MPPAPALDHLTLTEEAARLVITMLSALPEVDGLGRMPAEPGVLELRVALRDYDLAVCDRVLSVCDQVEALMPPVRVEVSFAAHQGRPVAPLLGHVLWLREGPGGS